jgi:hypothetical protein
VGRLLDILQALFEDTSRIEDEAGIDDNSAGILIPDALQDVRG